MGTDRGAGSKRLAGILCGLVAAVSIVPPLLHADAPSTAVRYEAPADPADGAFHHDHRHCLLVGSSAPELPPPADRLAPSPPVSTSDPLPRCERGRSEAPPRTGRPRGPPLLH